MNEREAQQMSDALRRVAGNATVGYASVDWYHNTIGQPVVRITWSTGPVHFVSVRECVREIAWLRRRGGPGGAWIPREGARE